MPGGPLKYEDIEIPKNTAMGLFIAGWAFFFGFGLIWHIWLLAAVGAVGVIVCIIARSFDEEIEYTLTAAEVAKIEHATR